MTPEAQRIAIAEACGWTDINLRIPCGCSPNEKNKKSYTPLALPDYLNDLNAMRAALACLSPANLRWYRNHLIQLTGTSEAIDATAAGRAEAFLRTLGKWNDAK